MPHADLNMTVDKTTDHTFFRIQKLRPYEGWGPLNFEFFVDNEDMEGFNDKYSRNYPQLRNQRNEMQAV